MSANIGTTMKPPIRGHDSSIAPPTFNGRWSDVKRELRIGTASTRSELLEKANAMCDAVSRQIFNEGFENVGEIVLVDTLILEKILGREHGLNTELLKMGRQVLSPGFWEPEKFILSLLTNGNIAEVRKEAPKLDEYGSYFVGVLFWMLGQNRKARKNYGMFSQKIDYVNKYPYGIGTLAHLLGGDSIADTLLESIQKEGVFGNKWENELLMKDSQVAYRETIWTGIFFALMAGTDLKALIPRHKNDHKN